VGKICFLYGTNLKLKQHFDELQASKDSHNVVKAHNTFTTVYFLTRLTTTISLLFLTF